MSRAIDADALEELFREVIGGIAKKPEMNGNLEHMVRASAMVIEMIQDAPTIEPQRTGRWISCSEQLPKQGQEVICQCRASIIKVLKLDADGDWYQDAGHCYMRGFVIAWMPLPEPWRGEEHGQSRE